MQRSKLRLLFDHIVGAGEQRRRDFNDNGNSPAALIAAGVAVGTLKFTRSSPSLMAAKISASRQHRSRNTESCSERDHRLSVLQLPHR
jgi:hypothetical protein